MTLPRAVTIPGGGWFGGEGRPPTLSAVPGLQSIGPQLILLKRTMRAARCVSDSSACVSPVEMVLAAGALITLLLCFLSVPWHSSNAHCVSQCPHEHTTCLETPEGDTKFFSLGIRAPSCRDSYVPGVSSKLMVVAHSGVAM